MKIGKLDNELLESLIFNSIHFDRDEVITKPGVGEDCALIDFGEYECVTSTDPITAAVNDVGRLSVHISCNDIASNGVEPLGIMLAVLLPPSINEEQIGMIMQQASEAAADIGVAIIGGHTEITPVVNQPVIVSTALGRAPKGASQKAKDMEAGDYILMTKWAGLEGTGIIAADCSDRLSSVLTAEEMAVAASMLGNVSVVKEGVLCGRIGTHGMHDVTEGGVLGAVWEMCEIAGLGCEIWKDSIPVHPVTEKICKLFDINPFRLISSGCMMIMAAPDKKDRIMADTAAAGVPISCIGRVLPLEKGRFVKSCSEAEEAGGAETEDQKGANTGEASSPQHVSENVSEVLTPPESDELYKVVHR